MKYPLARFLMISKDYRAYHLTFAEKALLLELKYLENVFCSKEKETFYRSDQQLAEALDCNAKTVKTAKKGLKDHGIIETEKKKIPGQREIITEYRIFI